MPRPITNFEFLQMAARTAPKVRQGLPPDDAVDRERDLHEQIETDCIRRGWAYVHSRMDKPSRVGVGVCDWVVFASGGRTLCVECKSRTGKLRPSQLIFKVQCEMHGHTVHVIQGFSEWLAIAEENKTKSTRPNEQAKT
jgi:hypothetical protein